jgi:hypothetical protein
MAKILFHIIAFSIITTQAIAQLPRNPHYEVVDSCNNTSRTVFPLEDGRLISYAKKGRGQVYLLDTNRNKIELPCQKVKWKRPAERSCFKCIKDDKSAFWPLQAGMDASPFYDSLSLISPDFYAVYQKDSLYIFNSKHERLLQATSRGASGRESKLLFRHCNKEQLICKVNDEEFFLNTKGEISQDGICDFELPNIYLPDSSYIFKKDKQWGVKSKDGSILIEADYNRIDHWQEGKLIVSVQQGNKGKYSYGVIDQNGKVLLPLEYDWIWDYEFGLSVRKKGDKDLFLDTNLKNKYKKGLDELRVSRCGLIRGKLGDQKFFDLIFTKKIEGTKGKIASAKSVTDERCQVVYENGLFVIYDTSGNIIFSHEGEANASRVYENILQVDLNPGSSGLIDATGKWIVEPGPYKFKSTKLTDGIYKVNLNSGQSDLINSRGELIYSNVKNGGLIPTRANYIVSNDQGTALVSPRGKLLVPFGKYRIHEFGSGTSPYYRLTVGNVDYVVRLK